jgi:hypothetical protein
MNTGECARNLAKGAEPLQVPPLTGLGKYDISVSGERGTARPPRIGGGGVTALETLALLNLLAVVIFGVLNVTKKK